MQLLAKFKKILYMGFRATSNLNPMHRFFLNFTKSCILSFLSKFVLRKNFTSVTKMIPTCAPVIGQFFDTMIVASIDKEW